MSERFKEIISALFVFLPLLAPYRVPGLGVNLQVFTLFVLSFWVFIKGAWDINFPRIYLLFFLYALICPIFGYLEFRDFGHFLSSYTPIVTFTFSFLMFRSILVFEEVNKWYRRFVYVSIIFFFVQEIMYVMLGWRVVGLLPFMPLSYDDLEMSEYIAKFSTLDRSASFFLEPAHFSQYIVGYLAINLGLLREEDRLFNRDSLIISLTLLMTFSGSAYLLSIIVWAIHLFSFRTQLHIRLFVIAIGIIGSSFVLNKMEESQSGSKVIERANSLNSTDEYGESEFIRIYRGWFVYDDVPFFTKVFGVGSSNVTCIIDNSTWRIAFLGKERYVNNAQCLAMGYGYIGATLFVLFLLSLCIRKTEMNTYLISIFVGLCFIESFWCTPLMLMYLLIPIVKNDSDEFVNSIQ